MTRLKKILFSTRTMTGLLLLFAISMVVATFIENTYDTSTAKALIYNAKWFELLMLWLILLFAVNIKTYKLLQREKWPLFVFHVAFILMFIGGAITRYTGFEGQMPIKEGQTTNKIISDLTYFKLAIAEGDKTLIYDRRPYRMSYFNSKGTKWPLKRTFRQNYLFGEKVVSLRSLDYIPLAKESVQLIESEKRLLKIVSVGRGGRKDNYLKEGEITNIDGILFSFNVSHKGAVQLMEKDGVYKISLPIEGQYMSMEGQQMGEVSDTTLLIQHSSKVKANKYIPLQNKALYAVNNINFVIPKNAFAGKIVYKSGDKNNPLDQNLLDVVKLELTSGNEIDTLLIKGGKGITGYDKSVRINGLKVSLGFGSKMNYTKFYLRCDDFDLDRYPGSTNPSSYESMITVIDKGKENQHQIYMNNVMDYKGYRFFQASYFPDESGTILSVNADWWGTNITYIGYFLLFFGMFFTLFWRGTHFWKLNTSLKKMYMRKTCLLPLIFYFGISNSFSQNSTITTVDTTISLKQNFRLDKQFVRSNELKANRIIDLSHAKKFGQLLVQDFQGRIKPMDTHTLELIRKIYKKDSYQKGRQTINSLQWFISMQIDPGSWVNEPMIMVSRKGGGKLIKETGANEKGFTSYANLVDPNTGIFKLEEQDEISFSKPKSEQSNYDKAVIELTERFTIFSNIAFGYYTQIIPIKNDLSKKWRSWIYASNENSENIDTIAYPLLTSYFNEVKFGLQVGDWRNANERIEEIAKYQQIWGEDVVPSKSKVNLEILYNHVNIFFWLMLVYSFLGVFMIILGFLEVFSTGTKHNRSIHILTKILWMVMISALTLQAIGLTVRWYLSGHAPWSNGYEAIIFISGVGVLAGLLLYRNRNAFIPAAGALVAMIMMGFAHGGAMLDPQITPLEPVLKSYWLMVHVGIITASYGFFGLSAVLSVISLVLFSTRVSKNVERSIKELTIVNEMALTVGIFALTIGTFLGGMWANESWGRYWSWDPKETWAFISIIFYAVVLHLRLVPKLRGKLTFNIVSLWAIWSIIFTYFGVNYYLSGLHSYAAGDPIPIPTWIYSAVGGMVVLSLVAYLRNKARIKQKLTKVN